VRTLDRRQGMKIASPEEIAFRSEWITAAELKALSAKLGKNDYSRYLRRILEDRSDN
jgi:glucose-1-phosphate thymidylyltransferase